MARPGRLALLTGCLLIVIAAAPTAKAQAPASAPAPAVVGAPEPNWDVIRKGPLSVADRAITQKWANASMDLLLSSADPATAGMGFYKRIRDEIRNSASSQLYREALAQLVVEGFTARYKPAANPPSQPPMGVVFLVMTLRQVAPAMPAGAEFNKGVDVLQSTLADPIAAVRAEAMGGLIQLQAAIPAPSRVARIQAIQKVALTETNPIVVGRMYAFITGLGNLSAAETIPAADALLAVLDARLGRIEQRTEWPCGGDAAAVTWLVGKSKALTKPGTLTNIANRTARLLADAVFCHVNQSPPKPIKEELERVALIAEEQLTLLFKAKVTNGVPPTPSVSSAITEATPKSQNIAAAVAKWIGEGSTPGLLNPPAAFGFPIGLGITRPVPATTPAS